MALERQTWARVAGLMFLLVLVVDLTGLAVSQPVLSRTLMLSGSILTVPLALGLYFTLKVFRPITSAFALTCRLIEALVGILATLVGFDRVATAFSSAAFGKPLLQFLEWNRATNFGAFIFTIGSTLFFLLFVRSRSIPRALAWLGLAASLAAFTACCMHLVRPHFPAMNAVGWGLMLLAEVSTGGWLLFFPLRQDTSRPEFGSSS